MAARRSSIKIGMLPILMLVVALTLFALAVLALSTAHAAGVISERQAATTSEGYEVEAAGQYLVGLIDSELASSSAADVTSAASALAPALPNLAANIEATHEGMSVSAELMGTQVLASLEGPAGRHLEIVLDLTSAQSYQVRRWSLTTAQADEGAGTNLWNGL